MLQQLSTAQKKITTSRLLSFLDLLLVSFIAAENGLMIGLLYAYGSLDQVQYFDIML